MAVGKCPGPEPGFFVPKDDDVGDGEIRCRPNGAAERAVRAALLKRYQRRWRHSTAEVTFSCDPIATPLRFIAHEITTQSYYELKLLWRDGTVFRALRVTSRRRPKLKGSKALRDTEIFRGTAPAKSIDAVHGQLRAYFSARIREVEAEAPGFASGHGRLGLEPPEVLYLVGENGGVVARRHDGHFSSEVQPMTLPFGGAFALLRPAFEGVTRVDDDLSVHEARAITEWAWRLRWGIEGEAPSAAATRAEWLPLVTPTRQWIPLLLHTVKITNTSPEVVNESVLQRLGILTGLGPGTGNHPRLAGAYYEACAPLYGLREGWPQ
jgi:hypothetical protein